MANTRPDIEIIANQDNDIYALLNAQEGHPAVNVGDILRIQNKSNSYVYLHQTDQIVTDFSGGTLLPSTYQSVTDVGLLGCHVTMPTGGGVIQVEVLSGGDQEV